MGWISKFRRGSAGSSAPLEQEGSPAKSAVNASAINAYSSDEPIASKEQDRFGRAPFAKRIAETIAHRVDPSSLVVGLFGSWGDGKTSVLKMMEEALVQHPNVMAIRFNPWHFPSEDTLLRGFFATLSSALGKEPEFKERAAELLQAYGGILSLISVSLPGIDINPGEAAKSIGESLSRSSLDQLKEKIDTLLGQSGKRLVILIDDIDRLDRDETHAIFKLVKLSASFRYTCYVLAFDDAVVASALGERYGSGGQEAGRAFLEKIIQVPLHLPRADRISLRQMAFEGVEQALARSDITLDQPQIDVFTRHFVDGLEPKLETPRIAKLYTNSLMFALPLIKGEVNIAEFMLIEGMRVFYPQLYAAIRGNPDLFLQGDPDRRMRNLELPTSPIDNLLEHAMPSATKSERENFRARFIAGLFPRAGNMTYGAEWDEKWAANQRVCSERYFRRYFVYGVPEGDIPDTAITTLISRLATSDIAGQRALLKSYSARAIPKLIEVLRERADAVEPPVALPLALAIAMNGDLLPQERGPFVLGGTFTQAGILISQLMRQIPDNERQAGVEGVVRSAEPLTFAMECVRWLTHSTDRREEYRVLPDEADEFIYALFADRVRLANVNQPLFQQFGRDAPGLYWHLQKVHGRADIESQLHGVFNAKPELLDQFLDTYVGEGWGIESGLPTRSDLRRNVYDEVVSIISPEYVVSNLRARYGPEIEQPQYRIEGSAVARRIAHQFAYIHQAVSAEEAAQTAVSASASHVSFRGDIHPK
jgi:predicted KAP-like P-loop ATPase